MAIDFAQEREKSLNVLTEARDNAASSKNFKLADKLQAQITDFPTKEFKFDESKRGTIDGKSVASLDEDEFDTASLREQMDASFKKRGLPLLGVESFDADSSDFVTPLIQPRIKTNANANKMEAIASAALTGSNSYDVAKEIKNELDLSGDSTYLNRMRELIATDSDASRREFLQQAISDPNRSEQEIADMLQGYAATREIGMSLRDEFAYRLSVVDSAETEEEASVQDVSSSVIDQIIEVNESKTRAENRIAINLDSSFLNTFSDMAMLLVPFLEQRMVTKIKQDLGQENSWIEAFFTGEGKQSIKDMLIRLDKEDSLKMHQLISDAINDNVNIMGVDNDLMKMYMSQELLGEHGNSTHLRVIDNTVALLDLVGVGMIAKRGMRSVFGGVKAGSPGGMAEAANAATAADELAHLLKDDSGVISEALSVERVDVASEVMPKPVGMDLKGAPDSVLSTVERLDKGAEKLLERTGAQRLIYTAEEAASTVQSGLEYLKTISGVKLRLGMTQIAEVPISSVEKGYFIKAIYGANETTGWKTLKSARTAATKSFGKDQPLDFYVRDPLTNKLHNVKTKEGKKQVVVNNGDYYIEYKYNQTYDSTIVGVFGSDAVTKIGSVPFLGKYLQDASSRFNQLIRGGAITYTDQLAGIERDLMHNTKKFFTALSEPSKAKLLKAIEEGSAKEKVWSYEELRVEHGMTDSDILAYSAFRRHQDTLWELNNREVYKGLQSQNMESVFIGGKDTGMFASRVDGDEIAVVFGKDESIPVYNPKTNEVVDVSWDDVVALYERDGSVAKLNQSVFVNNNKYSYVLTENSPLKGGATLLKPLTRTPLAYKPGYYQRFYEDGYVVRKVYPHAKLNGKAPPRPTTETLYTAGTKSDAEHIKERLELDDVDGGFEYEAVRSRDLEDASREVSDWDQMTRSGLLSTRHRGERLLTTEGLAEISDPLQSMVRGTKAVANKVALGEWFSTMRQRWANSYPDLMHEGKMPATVEKIKEQGRTHSVSPKDVNDAVAIFEYMKMMENIPTKISKKWQGVALDIAEALEKKSPLVSSMFRKTADTNIIRGIKSSAYMAFIALNPIRQFPIQASQLLQMLAIDGKYILTGGMVKDMSAISMGMAGQTKNGARMMGVSQKEYDEILEAFQNGGMPYAIDQHQFIEGSVARADDTLNPQSLPLRALKAPAKVIKGAYAGAKMIGFDAGEYANVVGHWLVAQRQWRKLNPNVSMKSQQAIDEVGQKAREMSYAMNRAGKLGHQGYPTSAFSEILSVPLQFFSIPHKAIMSMTTNKAYTKAEKLRLAALNFGLFGAVGIPGMNLLLEEAKSSYGVTVDDDTWVGIKGGLVDIALSRGLHHAFAEEGSDVDYLSFSKNISPTSGGGTPLANLYEGVTKNRMAKTLFGASYNVGSRIWQGASEMAQIVSEDDWSTPDKMAAGMKSLLSVTGGGSNYFKARFAQEYGKMVSSKGATTVDVGEVGAMMKLFGIGTYAEDYYYATVISDSDRKKDIEKDVNSFYDSHMSLMARNLSEKDWKAEVQMRQGIFNLYNDPQDRAIALDQFNKRMDMARSNNQDNLAYKQAQRMQPNSDMGKEVANRVRNNMAITQDNRDRLLEMFDAVLGNTREEE